MIEHAPSLEETRSFRPPPRAEDSSSGSQPDQSPPNNQPSMFSKLQSQFANMIRPTTNPNAFSAKMKPTGFGLGGSGMVPFGLDDREGDITISTAQTTSRLVDESLPRSNRYLGVSFMYQRYNTRRISRWFSRVWARTRRRFAHSSYRPYAFMCIFYICMCVYMCVCMYTCRYDRKPDLHLEPVRPGNGME